MFGDSDDSPCFAVRKVVVPAWARPSVIKRWTPLLDRSHGSQLRINLRGGVQVLHASPYVGLRRICRLAFAIPHASHYTVIGPRLWPWILAPWEWLTRCSIHGQPVSLAGEEILIWTHGFHKRQIASLFSTPDLNVDIFISSSFSRNHSGAQSGKR